MLVLEGVHEAIGAGVVGLRSHGDKVGRRSGQVAQAQGLGRGEGHAGCASGWRATDEETLGVVECRRSVSGQQERGERRHSTAAGAAQMGS